MRLPVGNVVVQVHRHRGQVAEGTRMRQLIYRRAAALLAAAATGATLAACGGGSSKAATVSAVGCNTSGAAATSTTQSYRYVLDVGPVEEMYAPGQVPSNHPNGGEVMYGGPMNMANGPNARHVEVHICSRSNDHVLTNANPVIKLADRTAGTTAQVPAATMQGLGAGQGDLHYGNNMILAPGHPYVVTVTVNGQTASLPFTSPATTSGSGSGPSTTMGGGMGGMG